MNQEDCIHLLKKVGCSSEVIEHSLAVAEYAREIAMRYNARHSNHADRDNPTDPANPADPTGHADQADIELVTAGALLHDIGRARSNGINHAVIGAEIARSFGLDAAIVRIIERHIGSGIPPDEAVRLGLPAGDYMPETIEEMIVAHADNLVDDTERIEISERIRRLTARGFDNNAIESMRRLHTAVMG